MSASSLHKHMQEHCIGRFNRVAPQDYFKLGTSSFTQHVLKFERVFILPLFAIAVNETFLSQM
jgi:hypothetical protein